MTNAPSVGSVRGHVIVEHQGREPSCTRRFHVAESLTRVCAYHEYLLKINGSLEMLGYDDWRHLKPFMDTHSTCKAANHGGCIDKWHAKGH